MRALMYAFVAALCLWGSSVDARSQDAKPGSPGKPGSSNQTAVAAIVDLNTATVQQLTSLPGIGPSTAQRIVEHREKIGGFKKIEELMNVRGIGEKSFLKLKPLVTVTPKGGKTGGGHEG